MDKSTLKQSEVYLDRAHRDRLIAKAYQESGDGKSAAHFYNQADMWESKAKQAAACGR